MTDPAPVQVPPWVSDACTLPTAEQPLRLAEFDSLFATAVRTVERIAPTRLRLTLSGAADVAATVSDLTARESDCCSFFTFAAYTDDTGRLTLDIGVPAPHTPVLDALASRAELASGAR